MPIAALKRGGRRHLEQWRDFFRRGWHANRQPKIQFDMLILGRPLIGGLINEKFKRVCGKVFIPPSLLGTEGPLLDL